MALIKCPECSSEVSDTDIGITIGVGLILGIWAAGDVILGMFVFFTRPNA